MGNPTEPVIALAALPAGQSLLVQASIAGAIVTHTLFLLGASFPLRSLDATAAERAAFPFEEYGKESKA